MKSSSHFHFKHFTVRHDRCTMKVGTDAVLLGAWVNVTDAQSILDIGTGSGVIALVLAQRTKESVRIESVEIEKDDADQALENFNSSPWSSRMSVHHVPLQEFRPSHQFDMIVTNPPYFNRSLEPPSTKRQQVRHTTTLSYDELLSAVVRLLAENGRFNLILPFQEALMFSELAFRYGLFCSRRYYFKTRREKPVERILMEFTMQAKSMIEGEILLYENGLEWSPSYRGLIADFYIKG